MVICQDGFNCGAIAVMAYLVRFHKMSPVDA